MENLIKEALSYTSSKIKKVYNLLKGNFPNPSEISKANPFNPHAFIIGKAILTLIEEGKEKATKEDIMGKAVSLGLYEIKPSKSDPSYIFSWWLTSLKANGFIS
jgi:hypothetical protein